MSEFDLDVRVTTTSDAKNPQHISITLCLTCPIVSCFYC
jgi:hypothetical protein